STKYEVRSTKRFSRSLLLIRAPTSYFVLHPWNVLHLLRTCMNLLEALHSGNSVFAAELRPPRAELATAEGMDAWIDAYHAVRRLTRKGTFVFLTDSAVGAAEEDNLRHLVTNLGNDVPRERIVPFLTS